MLLCDDGHHFGWFVKMLLGANEQWTSSSAFNYTLHEGRLHVLTVNKPSMFQRVWTLYQVAENDLRIAWRQNSSISRAFESLSVAPNVHHQ